jgi:hypothetical protein
MTEMAVERPEAEVDAPSAVEFMREALVKISEDDLMATAGLLARKRELLAPRLADAALARRSSDAVRPILDAVWATRRRADALLVSVGAPVLVDGLRALLHGGGDLGDRFTAFDALAGAIVAPVRCDLAGEFLHYLDPDSGWLWSDGTAIRPRPASRLLLGVRRWGGVPAGGRGDCGRLQVATGLPPDAGEPARCLPDHGVYQTPPPACTRSSNGCPSCDLSRRGVHLAGAGERVSTGR